MLRALQLAVALFVGLLGATLGGSAANAAPIVADSGTFTAGYISGDRYVTLGPGHYRFSLSFSGNVEDVSAAFAWDFSTTYYCDFHDGKGAVFCNGDDGFADWLVGQVRPGLYQTLWTELPNSSIPLIDSPFGPDYVRADTIYHCCGFEFNGYAATAGSYVYSYTLLPEPVTWVLLIVGFAGIGAALRRPRTAIALG